MADGALRAPLDCETNDPIQGDNREDRHRFDRTAGNNRDRRRAGEQAEPGKVWNWPSSIDNDERAGGNGKLLVPCSSSLARAASTARPRVAELPNAATTASAERLYHRGPSVGPASSGAGGRMSPRTVQRWLDDPGERAEGQDEEDQKVAGLGAGAGSMDARKDRQTTLEHRFQERSAAQPGNMQPCPAWHGGMDRTDEVTSARTREAGASGTALARRPFSRGR